MGDEILQKLAGTELAAKDDLLAVLGNGSSLFALFESLLALPAAALLMAAAIEMFLPLPAMLRLTTLIPIFKALGAKVNRPQRQSSERYFAGILLPMIIILSFVFLSLLFLSLAGFDRIICLILLILLLTLYPVQRQAADICRKLRQSKKEAAREALSAMVLRDVGNLSPMGIAKAAAEAVCTRLFAGWYAVMVWYLLMGVEGALLMQLIFVLNCAFNVKLPENSHFGLGCRRMLQTMLIPPAVVFALLQLWRPRAVARIKLALAQSRSCPNAWVSCFVLSLCGEITDMQLGGPRYYAGSMVRFAAIGGARPPAPFAILAMLRTVRSAGILLILASFVINLLLFVL